MKDNEERLFALRLKTMPIEAQAALKRHLTKVNAESGRLADIMHTEVGKWVATFFEDEIGLTRQMYRMIPMGIHDAAEQLRCLQAVETKLMEMRDRLKSSPQSRELLDAQIQMLDNSLRSTRQPADSNANRLVPEEIARGENDHG